MERTWAFNDFHEWRVGVDVLMQSRQQELIAHRAAEEQQNAPEIVLRSDGWLREIAWHVWFGRFVAMHFGHGR